MTILLQVITTRWLAEKLWLLDEHKIVAEKPEKMFLPLLRAAYKSPFVNQASVNYLNPW